MITKAYPPQPEWETSVYYDFSDSSILNLMINVIYLAWLVELAPGNPEVFTKVFSPLNLKPGVSGIHLKAGVSSFEAGSSLLIYKKEDTF